MTKWEYNLVLLPSQMTSCQIEIFLEKYGSQGWELCGIEYGCLIFKRLINDSNG